MQDLSVDGIRQMFGGPIFEGLVKILLLSEAMKFEGIIQKFNQNY